MSFLPLKWQYILGWILAPLARGPCCGHNLYNCSRKKSLQLIKESLQLIKGSLQLSVAGVSFLSIVSTVQIKTHTGRWITRICLLERLSDFLEKNKKKIIQRDTDWIVKRIPQLLVTNTWWSGERKIHALIP